MSFATPPSVTTPPSQSARFAQLIGLGTVLINLLVIGMVALALSLAGPELADLPRIWALLSQHPAEIMRLSDRGRLDQGCRADLVVVARDSGAVEATISAGRLIHLTGQARDRFAAVLPRGRDDMGIAAE